MNTSLTSVRLSRFALRFVAIASATLVILSLLLWMEGDFDRRFLLAHNLFRDNPAIVAFAGALSRFGMSAVCLLVLTCIAASVRFPAFREARPVLLVVLFSFCAATLVATLLKEPLGRARPIADLAGQLNVTSRHDSASFPSGHAAQSLALALPFVLIVAGGPVGVRLAKLAMLLVAGLVCYSRIVKGAHYPQLYAEAGLQYLSSQPNTPMDATTYYGGLRLQIPLFEGGLMKAEVAESKSKQRQAELSTELLKRNIQNEVADAYIQYQAITTVLETTKSQFEYAKKNFDTVEGLFAEGLVPSLSVIDAQQALFFAERELVTATFEQQLAVLRLQKAMGVLGKQQ